MRYTAGCNIPGFLPSGEPSGFDSFGEAKACVLSILLEVRDEGSEALGGKPWSKAARAEFKAALAEAKRAKAPFTTPTMPDGYVYWVVESGLVLEYPYTFNYPDFGLPDGYPDYTAHRGAKVRIVRQLARSECDEECGIYYWIEADDGWTGNADHSELSPDPSV